VAFENADFFSLYEHAKEALSPDMVASEQLELRPGETLELKLSVEEGSRYIGILAAYRDLPDSKWRYTVEVTPQETTDVALIHDQSGNLNAQKMLAKADD